ncbi:hypothetical protein BC832DRAFT_595094 [Gaertneriomyces semiglobifer]|nr:hypothetical protein BC832DRAFT_595094 [Gaertneriomyces semiglobifer]
MAIISEAANPFDVQASSTSTPSAAKTSSSNPAAVTANGNEKNGGPATSAVKPTASAKRRGRPPKSRTPQTPAVPGGSVEVASNVTSSTSTEVESPAITGPFHCTFGNGKCTKFYKLLSNFRKHLRVDHLDELPAALRVELAEGIPVEVESATTQQAVQSTAAKRRKSTVETESTPQSNKKLRMSGFAAAAVTKKTPSSAMKARKQYAVNSAGMNGDQTLAMELDRAAGRPSPSTNDAEPVNGDSASDSGETQDHSGSEATDSDSNSDESGPEGEDSNPFYPFPTREDLKFTMWALAQRKKDTTADVTECLTDSALESLLVLLRSSSFESSKLTISNRADMEHLIDTFLK